MQRRMQSNRLSWELAPPAIMTSAAPRWITLAASLTASRLEISAWWIVLFGPRASVRDRDVRGDHVGQDAEKPNGKLAGPASVPQRPKSNRPSTMQRP